MRGLEGFRASGDLPVFREAAVLFFSPPSKCSGSVIPDDVLKILESIYRSDEPQMKDFLTRTLKDFLEVIRRTPPGRKKRSQKQTKTKVATKMKLQCVKITMTNNNALLPVGMSNIYSTFFVYESRLTFLMFNIDFVNVS